MKDGHFPRAARKVADARMVWRADLHSLDLRASAGEDIAEAMHQLVARADAIDVEVERIRRRHFPHAHKLIITDEEAITLSRTGRSLMRVWRRRANGTR